MKNKILLFILIIIVLGLGTYGYLKFRQYENTKTANQVSDNPIVSELANVSNTNHEVVKKFTPILTKSFVDNFASNQIDNSKWDVIATDGVTAQTTSEKNLLFSISSGSVNNSQRSGTLSFKSQIGEDKDFTIEAMVLKPRVDGNGDTVSGVKFYSDKQTGAEIVSLKWVRNAQNGSKIIMQTHDKQGKLVEVGSVNYEGDQVKLRLVRAQNAYRGVYFPNNDPDSARTIVGEIPTDKDLGVSGYLALFANNHPIWEVNQNYPKVEAQFDNTTIEWQEGTGHVWKGIYDPFNAGSIGSEWKVQTNNGVSVAATSDDKLTFTADPLTSDAVKYRDGYLYSNTTAPKNVDFIATAVINKPNTYGDGIVSTGVDFSPPVGSSDQGIAIRWQIQKGGDKEICRLRLVVHDSSRKLVRVQELDIPVSTPWITVQLSRSEGNKYTALYKLSGNDVDVPWVKLGNPENITMNSLGTFGLFAGSASGGTLPAFTTKIDFFSAGWPQL